MKYFFNLIFVSLFSAFVEVANHAQGSVFANIGGSLSGGEPINCDFDLGGCAICLSDAFLESGAIAFTGNQSGASLVNSSGYHLQVEFAIDDDNDTATPAVPKFLVIPPNGSTPLSFNGAPVEGITNIKLVTPPPADAVTKYEDFAALEAADVTKPAYIYLNRIEA